MRRNRDIFTTVLALLMESDKVYGTKYCAFELDGEAKYYVCPRNEYCCNFGCCVNLAFQFYQLWYYWLLIIVMFMICSGGGWWYRFCRQNEASTTYPSMPQPINTHFSPPNTRDLHRRNSTEMSTRRSRSTHYHGRSRNRDQFYLSQMWKGPSNQFPPSYFSSSQYTNQPPGQQPPPFHQECPYHMLYGPPPSYDSVIQISDTTGNTPPVCTLVNSTSITQLPNDVGITDMVENVHVPPSSAVMPSTSANESPEDKRDDSLALKSIKHCHDDGDEDYDDDGVGGCPTETVCDARRSPNQINETQFSTIPSTSRAKAKDEKGQITSV